MKQKDCFVRITGPCEAQNGGPDDAAKLGHATHAKGIGGLNIAFGNRAQSAGESFSCIGSGVQKQHNCYPQPRLGKGGDAGKTK